MAVSFSTLRTRFPQTFGDLAAFPDSVLVDAVAAANLRIDAVLWGTCADEGCLFLAAHLALIDPRGKSSGIGSASAGKVRIVFDRSTAAETFRVEYERLQRGIAPVAFVGGSEC